LTQAVQSTGAKPGTAETDLRLHATMAACQRVSRDNAARYVIFEPPRRVFPLADSAACRGWPAALGGHPPTRRGRRTIVPWKCRWTPCTKMECSAPTTAGLSGARTCLAHRNQGRGRTRPPKLDIVYLESLQTELLHAGPAPGIEEVRRRLSKIPGSMTGDFIAEREDRSSCQPTFSTPVR